MKIDRNQLLHSQHPTGVIWPGQHAGVEDYDRPAAIRLACMLFFEAGFEPTDLVTLLVKNPDDVMPTLEGVDDTLDSAHLHRRLAEVTP